MNTDKKTPHWIPCPICNQKTDVKVYENTALFNFPLLCPHCNKETKIHVFQLKISEAK